MKKLTVSVAVVLAAWMVVSSFTPQVMAAPRLYSMAGKIQAVDPVHNTVAINIPEGRGNFTVAGAVSSHATLKMNGKAARLADFKPGDRVHVKWESTSNGHLIDMLVRG
ncbi:MAG: hypothetical protein AB1640_16500 [bacterium]